jgi:2,5-diketo-D-gluconate reductase A
MSSIPTLRLNDGRTAPQLGLGVWQVPDVQVADVVRTALDVGYRSIDTATIYGNERGVGQGIRDSAGKRLGWPSTPASRSWASTTSTCT